MNRSRTSQDLAAAGPRLSLEASRRITKYGALAVCGSVVGLLSGPVLRYVVNAGHYIVEHDLAADYITGVVWASILGVLILVWPIARGDRLPLLGLWFAKAFVALVLMLPYEAHYTSLDSFGYFGEGREPSFDWSTAGWGEGSANLSAMAWLHNHMLPDSYHALKITFAMIGFIGVYVMYRSAVAAGAPERRSLLVFLALTPSVIFWSSVVAKDPVLLFGISIYCYGIVRWVRRGAASWLLLAAAGTLLAAFFRLWLGPILTMPVVIVAFFATRSAVQRMLISFAALIVLGVGVQSLGEKFFNDFDIDILEAATGITEALDKGGSARGVVTPFSGPSSVVAFIPGGMFTALFRPLPGEVRNSFGALAGIENVGLLLLFVVAVWRTRLRDFRDPVVLWATLLILSWGMFYGFLSQNLGTASRYRLQILPLQLLLLLYLASRQRFSRVPSSGPDGSEIKLRRV